MRYAAAGFVAGLCLAPVAAGSRTDSEAAHDIVHEVVCFSGGREIYRGRSDPAFQFFPGRQDPHLLFVDTDNHQVRVNGDCVVLSAPETRP